MRWTGWLFVACAACGGSSPQSTAPAPAPIEPHPAPAPVAASERDCDELITHAVALGIDEEARGSGARTTEADHEAVRRQLHEELMNDCRQLPRDTLRCALAATTLDALAQCKPSSSTSNSNVAPGGIAPPAPRAP